MIRVPWTWTDSGRIRGWLREQLATEVGRHSGFIFYEHPIYGDEAPVLAVTEDSDPDLGDVWNTQDFDVPNVADIADLQLND